MQILYWTIIVLLCCIAVPLLGIIAIGIAVTSGFPILFFQERVGKNGKIFTIYKFRTMIVGASDLQRKLWRKNQADGPVFKMYHDPRYTRFGKFLAHTGLDELPQLYNVLRGDMALLGPRPLPISEERQLKSWQKAREQIKPGIISPWVVEGYHQTPFIAWMKSDIAYTKNKTFLYDVHLTFRALGFLFQLLGKEILAIVE